jgi:hypothetical protein
MQTQKTQQQARKASVQALLTPRALKTEIVMMTLRRMSRMEQGDSRLKMEQICSLADTVQVLTAPQDQHTFTAVL